MRVIETIPHPLMNIQILKMNDKYIIRFEAGPMEQIYKINPEEFCGIETLKQKLNEPGNDEQFIENFKKMKNLFAIFSK
jgi:hypothetical protein